MSQLILVTVASRTAFTHKAQQFAQSFEGNMRNEIGNERKMATDSQVEMTSLLNLSSLNYKAKATLCEIWPFQRKLDNFRLQFPRIKLIQGKRDISSHVEVTRKLIIQPLSTFWQLQPLTTAQTLLRNVTAFSQEAIQIYSGPDTGPLQMVLSGRKTLREQCGFLPLKFGGRGFCELGYLIYFLKIILFASPLEVIRGSFWEHLI